MMRFVGSIVLLFGIIAAAQSEPVATIDTALRLGYQRNQKVFIFFSAPWCRYCTQMKTLFNDRDVKSKFDKYITVTVDVTTDRNGARRYAVGAIPDYMVINARTNGMTRAKGAVNKAAFITWLDRAR